MAWPRWLSPQATGGSGRRARTPAVPRTGEATLLDLYKQQLLQVQLLEEVLEALEAQRAPEEAQDH